jgi:hypothetical protein
VEDEEKNHTFLVVSDEVKFMEEGRDWLDLYVKVLKKFHHKADMGTITTPNGKNFLYIMLQMPLNSKEIDIIKQVTSS